MMHFVDFRLIYTLLSQIFFAFFAILKSFSVFFLWYFTPVGHFPRLEVLYGTRFDYKHHIFNILFLKWWWRWWYWRLEKVRKQAGVMMGVAPNGEGLSHTRLSFTPPSWWWSSKSFKFTDSDQNMKILFIYFGQIHHLHPTDFDQNYTELILNSNLLIWSRTFAVILCMIDIGAKLILNWFRASSFLSCTTKDEKICNTMNWEL